MEQSNTILQSLRKELKLLGNEKTRHASLHFFKESVEFYGIKAAIVKKVASKYYIEIKNQGKAPIVALCEDLLKSGIFEESLIAYSWAEKLGKVLEPHDFSVFEKWVKRYVSNWASCDSLCNHTIGSFIEKYPVFVNNLKLWAKSDNRWVKRASVVTLILPARKGLFLADVFELADTLLLDKDDLVQKGYGWMLKEASKLHQAEVFDYIMKHKDAMPRTALRYAIEKMPKDLKKSAMGRG